MNSLIKLVLTLVFLSQIFAYEWEDKRYFTGTYTAVNPVQSKFSCFYKCFMRSDVFSTPLKALSYNKDTELCACMTSGDTSMFAHEKWTALRIYSNRQYPDVFLQIQNRNDSLESGSIKLFDIAFVAYPDSSISVFAATNLSLTVTPHTSFSLNQIPKDDENDVDIVKTKDNPANYAKKYEIGFLNKNRMFARTLSFTLKGHNGMDDWQFTLIDQGSTAASVRKKEPSWQHRLNSFSPVDLNLKDVTFDHEVGELKVPQRQAWIFTMYKSPDSAIIEGLNLPFKNVGSRGNMKFIISSSQRDRHLFDITVNIYGSSFLKRDITGNYLFLDVKQDYAILDDIRIGNLYGGPEPTWIDKRATGTIVVKFDLYLHRRIYFKFIVRKNDDFVHRGGPMKNILIGTIFQNEGNGKYKTIQEIIKLPLISSGNIQGFTLRNTVFGGCLKTKFGKLFQEFPCTYFRSYYYNTYMDEFGNCIYWDNYEDKTLTVAYCNKSRLQEQNMKKTHQHNDFIFHITRQPKNYITTKNRNPNLIKHREKLGWIYYNNKGEDLETKVKAIRSYRKQGNVLAHSFEYKRDGNEESSIYISHALFRHHDVLTIRKTYSHRLWVATGIGINEYNYTLQSKNGSIRIIKPFYHDSLISLYGPFRMLNWTTTSEFENEDVVFGYKGIFDKKLLGHLVMPTKKVCPYFVKQKNDVWLSCKQIKRYCPSAASGYFKLWIGSTISEMYCDLETDEGGWLQLFKLKVPMDLNAPIVNTNSLDEFLRFKPVQNETPYLVSPSGTLELLQKINYEEIKFFCQTKYPKVTVHFKTLKGEYGHYAFSYFHHWNVDLPQACGSYQILDDDSSVLTRDCSILGISTGDDLGKWSSPEMIDRNDRLYMDILIRKTFAAYSIQGLFCDKVDADVRGATFIISVR